MREIERGGGAKGEREGKPRVGGGGEQKAKCGESGREQREGGR